GYDSQIYHPSEPLNCSRTAQIVERGYNALVSLFEQPEEAKIPVVGGEIGVPHYRRTFLKNSCAVSVQRGMMQRTEQTAVMLGKAHAISIVSLTPRMSRAPRRHDGTGPSGATAPFGGWPEYRLHLPCRVSLHE